MNDDFFCCDGDCTQGRKCPRYRRRVVNEIEWVIRAVVIVMFAAVASGYLWALFNG